MYVQKQQASCEKLSGMSIEAATATIGGGAIVIRGTREGACERGSTMRRCAARGYYTRSDQGGGKKKRTDRYCDAAVISSTLRRMAATARSCFGFVPRDDGHGLRSGDKAAQ